MKYITSKVIIVLISSIGIVSTITYAQDSFDTQYHNSQAQFDFFQGVNLLNEGYIPESLVAFQRAISVEAQPLYEYLYAKANEAYGLNKAAEHGIRTLLAKDFSSAFLRSKLEISQFSQRNTNVTTSLSQLVRVHSVDLAQFGFSAPMNIRVLPNGNLAIVFLSSHEVIITGASGKKIFSLSNGLGVIKHPTDVLFSKNQYFLVSSFTDDVIYHFTDKGIPLGNYLKFPQNTITGDTSAGTDALDSIEQKFKGPQYLTEDSEGNLYVTTYGTSQVFKFSIDGEYLFHFGDADGVFRGFSDPTGIEIVGDTLFVADYLLTNNKIKGVLYLFDKNGNYLDEVQISDQRIENIRKQNDNTLLLTVNKEIVRYDYSRRGIVEKLEIAEFSKLISADFDKNNLLWIVDQGRNRLEAYSYLTGQYTGLHPRILSVDTSLFPRVIMKVFVKNVFGFPLVGLSKENLIVFEDNRSVPSFVLEEELSKEDVKENIVIIPSVDSLMNPQHKTRITDAVSLLVQAGQDSILTEKNDIRFWLLSTKNIPEYFIEDGVFHNRIMNALAAYTPKIEDNQYLAKTIRFALNTLLTKTGGRTIVFAGKFPSLGEQDELLWNQIKEILQYHYINLVWIDDDLEDSVIPGDFQNIFSVGRGWHTTYLDTDVMNDIQQTLYKGIYNISYKSSLPVSLGQQYVPLEIETEFFSRSGKDLHGYVTPAQ